ncbi:hypothetical protein ASD52_03940 [Ensifer sp. Root142]|nr:hypothetical protein ASD52_03940 [Ensifer sp. Root142]
MAISRGHLAPMRPIPEMAAAVAGRVPPAALEVSSVPGLPEVVAQAVPLAARMERQAVMAAAAAAIMAAAAVVVVARTAALELPLAAVAMVVLRQVATEVVAVLVVMAGLSPLAAPIALPERQSQAGRADMAVPAGERREALGLVAAVVTAVMAPR